MLAPHIGAAEARVLADGVLERLRSSPLTIGAQPAVVSASVGVADLGDGTLTADEAFSLADASMYEAKRAGRGPA